jgi:glutathione S-transferase
VNSFGWRWEEAGVPYVDVARQRGGMPKMMASLDGERMSIPVCAAGAAGGRTADRADRQHPDVPRRKAQAGAAFGAGRLWANQLQLTIADIVNEAHDTHHPIPPICTTKTRRRKRKRARRDSREQRIPKSSIISRRGARPAWRWPRACPTWTCRCSALIEGLRYAFPKAMARLAPSYPKLIALHDKAAAGPTSPPTCNPSAASRSTKAGIFRHYPELDQ